MSIVILAEKALVCLYILTKNLFFFYLFCIPYSQISHDVHIRHQPNPTAPVFLASEIFHNFPTDYIQKKYKAWFPGNGITMPYQQELFYFLIRFFAGDVKQKNFEDNFYNIRLIRGIIFFA